MSTSSVRALVDGRYVIQKGRIAFDARLGAIERGDDIADAITVQRYTRWRDRFQVMEDDADQELREIGKDIAIVQMLCDVKGISFLLAMQLISYIDIERANTVSALWRYAGYAVIDGERERPVKGEKLHYNARLKTICYKAAGSFLKCSSPYRAIYNSARAYYDENRLDWTKGHCHLAAMRKMTKVFLQHLWIVWRTLEGLPTRNLYSHEYLGHTQYHKPEDFGWEFNSDN